MNFENSDLYHIYNQGNNKTHIFFTRENYIFFLKKIKKHILPHADVLAWCLMPNHFHLMVYVHSLEVSYDNTQADNLLTEKSEVKNHICNFNDSIGTMLSSYTRSVNIQEDRSGSLFRIHTHSECLTKPDLHTPAFFNTEHGTLINRHLPEKEYPQVCFNYIHNNPVKAGLVKHPEDWEFSSYSDYYAVRKGKIVNKKRTEEFGIV